MTSGIQLADAAELAAFLRAHPDVQAVQIMITDPSGVLRGKAVLRSELERIFVSGRQVAGSILGLDITGKDVDDTGLVWDTGDADMTARPIAGTLTRAPWLATPTGQLPHVPRGTRWKALMSSQWLIFWSAGTGLPTQFGRSLPR